MILNRNMTLEQFEEEMQVRVVKYGHKSKAAKEALRFAKQQADPGFFQIAADKVNAQKQFLSETYGPSKFELLCQTLRPFFPKEVVMTVLLLSSAIIGYDFVRDAIQVKEPTNKFPSLDIDELSRRMSLEIKENSTLNRKKMDDIKSELQTDVSDQMASTDWRSLVESKMKTAFDESKIAKSTVDSVVATVEKIDINQLVLRKIEDAIAKASIDEMVVRKLGQVLSSKRVDGLLQTEVAKVVNTELARQETKLQQSFDNRIVQLTEQLAELVDKRLSSFTTELAKSNENTRKAAVKSAAEQAEVRMKKIKNEIEQTANAQFAVKAQAIENVLDGLQADQKELPKQLQSQINEFVRSDEFSSVMAKSILRSLAQEQQLSVKK